ncbi:hypothetical protein, partial [Nocardia sp. 852002-51244_SCH5132740]|uniref:hypothetical protein n=1 Tax=Nocardia sp. 852002-51244_SCH5132740 TaxID=1834099 RepID=UPI0012EAC5AC
MNDSGTLDAEYRAFIKALHPATVETVVAVDTFWDDLYPAIVDVAERALEDRDPDPRDPGELDFYREWRETIRPKLLTLVAGHPDPDVRNAAEVLDKRLRNALFYMNPTHAASEKGEEVTVALDRGHDGLADLRR